MLALDSARLAALDVAIARRVVRQAILLACPDCRLEARHVNRVLSLVAAGAGSASVPMGVDCRVEYGLLFVRAADAAARGDAAWLEVPGTVRVAAGATISARLLHPDATDPTQVARAHGLEWKGASVLLDAVACGLGELGGRLWVDAPQPGEVMCPLGMHVRPAVRRPRARCRSRRRACRAHRAERASPVGGGNPCRRAGALPNREQVVGRIDSVWQ